MARLSSKMKDAASCDKLGVSARRI